MKIFINGEALSFSLEKEKSLFDIYQALSGWAGTQGARITGLAVNGRDMDMSLSGEWGGIALDSVRTVEVRAIREENTRICGLSVIREYLIILTKALEADEERAVREILKEYPYIRTGLELHVKDIFADTGGRHFESDAILLEQRDSPFTSAEKQSILSYVRAVSLIVQDRLQEIEEPEKEAAAVARLLLAAKPGLENVPVLLQSGKDREAMQSILSYTELTLKAIRILAQRTEGREDSNDFCKDLNGILNELRDAFEARDSVLIGDLFEYEIAPRTDRLAEILEGGRA
ncbi:MAG: hypothetical protein LBQ57_10720 [Spirochaetales bacterium]|jgi:hypothetical protein|nr:hypothetical protein [Spirochaetales bacterium]